MPHQERSWLLTTVRSDLCQRHALTSADPERVRMVAQDVQALQAQDKTSRRVDWFIARDVSAVASLLHAFPEAAQWNHEVSKVETPSDAVSAKIVCPLACLSREALLELVDVMMTATHESGCIFDAFHADLVLRH